MYELQIETREQMSLFDFGADTNIEMEEIEVMMPRGLFDEESEQSDAGTQILGLGDQPEQEKRNGFWRRQFQVEPTRRQKQYDWFFGVVMPVICFFFDLGIFSSYFGGDAIFGTFKPFAYLLSFFAIIAMMAWLIWGEQLKWISAFIAGLLLTSGIVALVIGVVLLPFSLMGLVLLVGALGFTPLFTGIVYLRNGVRAMRATKPFLPKSTLTYTILLSSLTAGVVPYVVNTEIYRIMKRIETGDANTIRREGQKLWPVAPLVDADALTRRYYVVPGSETQTVERAQALADVYYELTGKNIDNRHGF